MPRARNETESRIHLTRGASYLVIQAVATNAVQVVSFVVLARLISTQEMGILAILGLINATCVIFVTLSIPQAVTKFVAENASQGTKSETASAFYQALRTTLVISIPVIIGIYLAAPLLASSLIADSSYALLFRVLAVDVLLNAGAIPVLTGALLGLRMFRETAVVGLIVGAILRQVLILTLIVLMGFVGLVVAWVVSDVVMALVYFGCTLRALGPPRFNFSLVRLFRFSLPLTFGNIASYAQTWFDRALLVAFVPLSALGVYNAALTAFGVLNGISGAMNNMLFPAYSSIQNMDSRNMREATRLATRYSSFTLVPLSFGLLATAKPALTLFVGQSYAQGTLPLVILSTGFAVSAFGLGLFPVLLALEETTANAIITSISVLVSIGVAYVLLPHLGIVGASWARTAGLIIDVIITLLFLERKIVLQVDVGAVVKNLLAGSTMAAILIAVQIVDYNKFLLPLYVLIGMVVYLLMLRVLKAVDQEDLDLLKGFLGRRFSVFADFLGWLTLGPD